LVDDRGGGGELFIYSAVDEGILDRRDLKETKKLEMEECMERVSQAFILDLNSEMSPDMCILVSLVDERTKMRMKIPARGKLCAHMDCFDLATWLEEHQNTAAVVERSKCEICEQEINMEDIVIDSFIQDILEKTANNVKQVSICMDGTWYCTINETKQTPCASSKETAHRCCCEKTRERGKKKSQANSSNSSCDDINKKKNQSDLNREIKWKEEVAKLEKSNIVKITEQGTYYCLLCDTGGMTITTLMSSHVLGKKHIIGQRKAMHGRKKKRTISSSCSEKKARMTNANHHLPQTQSCHAEVKSKHQPLPFIVPLLNRTVITPIVFKSRNIVPEKQVEKELEKNLYDPDLAMEWYKPEEAGLKENSSKYFWSSSNEMQDPTIEGPSFFAEESWGAGQSWVAQLEAQEKHLPD